MYEGNQEYQICLWYGVPDMVSSSSVLFWGKRTFYHYQTSTLDNTYMLFYCQCIFHSSNHTIHIGLGDSISLDNGSKILVMSSTIEWNIFKSDIVFHSKETRRFAITTRFLVFRISRIPILIQFHQNAICRVHISCNKRAREGLRCQIDISEGGSECVESTVPEYLVSEWM